MNRAISFFALLVLTSAETYYVTPSSNTPCPEEGVPCFTLSQYANKSSNYFASNTTLILLPGNHSLDSELIVQNITFFTLSSSNTTSYPDTSITCYQFARFGFESIDTIGIRRLAVFGCVNNEVNKIKEFTINNCSFNGQEGNGTGLILVNVSIANIAKCVFYFFNGAILIFNSKLTTISNSIFQNNTATGDQIDGGGALSAYLSQSIIIVNSTLSNNNGQNAQGGAIFIDECSKIVLINSTLEGNSVMGEDGYGGAVNINSSSSITIVNSFLNNNIVTGNKGGFGGAVYVGSRSNITIINSTLNNNIVTAGLYGTGGALFAISSLNITIVYSTLNNNTATGDQGGCGGAVVVYPSTNITIVNCILNNNTATMGGAMYVHSSQYITIVNSTLNNNKLTREGRPRAGGAMWVASSPNIMIVNSTFNYNMCNGSVGGAVYVESSPNITIVNSKLNGNTVTGGNTVIGGAVFAYLSPNIIIVESTLNDNIVTGVKYGKGGAVFAELCPNITIINSTLNNNTVTAGLYGTVGALFPISRLNTTIAYSTLNNNTATGDQNGSVVVYSSPNITIVNNILNNHSDTGTGGGAMYVDSSQYITIVNCTLNNNKLTREGRAGGAMWVASSPNIMIVNSTFNYNMCNGLAGGLVNVDSSPNITIVNSKLNGNTVTGGNGGIGGAVNVNLSPNIIIVESTLNDNIATGVEHGGGGAVFAESWPNITIINSTLNNNTVIVYQRGAGGAVYVDSSPNVTIVNTSLNSNTVTADDAMGGAVHVINSEVLLSTVTIVRCIFVNNKAKMGSVLYLTFITFNSNSLLIIQNNMASQGTIYAIQSTLQFLGNTTLANNVGSVVLYSCNLTFTGYTTIENSNSSEEGGAINAFQSEIFLLDRVDLMYNRATRGGAITVKESKLYVYGDIKISHNTALKSGGGIYAYQSELNFNKQITIRENSAYISGGGIYAISSTIKVTNGSKAYIIGNYAQKGGGINLEKSAKIYLLKQKVECPDIFDTGCISNSREWISLLLNSNTANFGGAVYVADDTASTTCHATPFSSETTIQNECFIQELLPYSINSSFDLISKIKINFCNTYFINNSAKVAGNVLYGGLLDRCGVSPIAETVQNYSPSITSISYILNITNLTVHDVDSNKTISSDPVRVCFCKDNKPNCSYHPQPKYIRKGQTFTVSLVTVDHINNSLANSTTGVPKIHAYVSIEAELGEGQSIQETNGDGSCTDLVYSILSPHNTEELHLYADGPCKDAGISIANLTINFSPCPIGFEDNGLGCECDPIIYPEYISNCSIDTETVQRKDNNVWFAYQNDTDHQGYILHKHCPFDYCHPATENVSVNLNIVNGANELCAFNRSGKLCGSCEDGLSLSLGSSHCRPCSNNWLALFIVFALAGVALIAFILKVNFVVAEGTFHALILYANIFAANHAIFFPQDQTKILSVFIAWINLDLGFETCLSDGMDGYVKTWLQLAFPLYVILLVAAIIIISDHSTRFAMLFVGKNPIATLATLILLSYTKLLRTIISALQFTTLTYSNSTSPSELVWLADANIPYLNPKHIPLFITALLILIVGTAFTLILFAWQWLVYCPNRGPLRWIISNGKFIAFIDAYHNPYHKDHRYWVGLLFLVRVVLYLVSAVNVLGDPRVNLLSIAIVITSVLTFQIFITEWKCNFIHKKKRNNILDIISLLNLIALSVATLFINEAKNQSVVAYISTGIAFATFLAILVHHVKAFVKKEIFEKIKFKVYKFFGVNREINTDDHTLSPPCHPYKESIADHETEVNALPEPLDTVDTPREQHYIESVKVLLTETESNSNSSLNDTLQPLQNQKYSPNTPTTINTLITLAADSDSPDQDLITKEESHYPSLTASVPLSYTLPIKNPKMKVEMPALASGYQCPSPEDYQSEDDEYTPLLP